MDRRFLTIILLALGVGLALLNLALHYDHGSLGYDEGDYFQAVDNGFFANWWDADDISTIAFIRTGIDAVRGEIPRGELSRSIRDSKSSAFYRHYHPPAAFYPAIITHAVAPGLSEERQLRIGNHALLILWLVFFGWLAFRYPDVFSPWIVLIPASANWLGAFTGFNMHILFGLAVATFFLLWYGYERDRTRTSLKRIALFFLAVALCSVEYSLFLIGLLVLWGVKSWWTADRDRRGAMLRTRGRDLLWLIGFIALIWPAGVFKLGLLKSYALQAYIALFRLGDISDSFTSFGEMLLWKWSTSPVEIGIYVLAIGAIIWKWREVWNRGSLFVSIGLSLAITYTQLKGTLSLRWYLFPVFAIVYILYLHILSERFAWKPRKEIVAAFCGMALLFPIAQFTYFHRTFSVGRDLRDQVATLPEAPIISAHDMVPQLGAYFPGRDVRGYYNPEFTTPILLDSIEIWHRDHILVLADTVPFKGQGGVRVGPYVVYPPERRVP